MIPICSIYARESISDYLTNTMGDRHTRMSTTWLLLPTRISSPRASFPCSSPTPLVCWMPRIHVRMTLTMSSVWTQMQMRLPTLFLAVPLACNCMIFARTGIPANNASLPIHTSGFFRREAQPQRFTSANPIRTTTMTSSSSVVDDESITEIVSLGSSHSGRFGATL